jgi:hypothetical protein
LLFFFLKADNNNFAVGFFLGRQWLAGSFVLYFFGFNLLVFFTFVIKKALSYPYKDFIFFLKKEHCPIACFLATFAWFIIFGQSYFFGVRYYLHMLPFFIFCCAWSMTVLFRSRQVVATLSIAIIFLLNVCSYGMNYNEHDYDQGSVRSLEYRSAVRFQMKVVKQVESQFSGFTLAAPIMMAQALGIEKLGYAQKKMDVKIYFWPSKYGGVGELKGSDDRFLDRIIWIEIARRGKPSLINPFLDRVLAQVSYGSQTAKIFIGGSWIFLILQKAQPHIDAFERRTQ